MTGIQNHIIIIEIKIAVSIRTKITTFKVKTTCFEFRVNISQFLIGFLSIYSFKKISE